MAKSKTPKSAASPSYEDPNARESDVPVVDFVKDETGRSTDDVIAAMCAALAEGARGASVTWDGTNFQIVVPSGSPPSIDSLLDKACEVAIKRLKKK
jgi:hypothetical protein